ncbi:ABC transporter ATP-binding protein [Staphylococcus argensis]|uniref:Bacitracin ABC transporter ATP-binding protein n=1 Tax=Staphylococcus argensis TaxID=1607738 RepID=A0A2K4FBE5_9STAP|nr:ABC transporter ATP-binding protein [Staphylococcus argensis]MCY6991795.1 ABC transporter ATP-binding protein [Staphylococcus argensis]POA08596.1 bacitracin ABC transporter ATP-binding protein [Staphylococcus argensis]
MNNIIHMSDISKRFGNKVAIEHLDFKVKRGEIFGFLGPSGAGKTTTINMLTGNTVPSKGSLNVMDFTGSSIGNKAFLSKIGILSDESTAYQRLSVWDNLKIFAKLYNQSIKKAEEILDFINLNKEKKTLFKNLSKGMKQRVLLGRSLLHNPELLFLDEPTASLDPTTMEYIHKGLVQLNKQGTTIFLTTHNMEEATKLCHRVALLNEGRIQLLDTPENLRYRFSNQQIKVINCKNEIKYLPLTEETGEYIKTLIHDNNLKYISTDLPHLDEIFIKVTGKELV